MNKKSHNDDYSKQLKELNDFYTKFITLNDDKQNKKLGYLKNIFDLLLNNKKLIYELGRSREIQLENYLKSKCNLKKSINWKGSDFYYLKLTGNKICPRNYKYKWGIGIEHEYVPIFSNKDTNINFLTKVLKLSNITINEQTLLFLKNYDNIVNIAVDITSDIDNIIYNNKQLKGCYNLEYNNNDINMIEIKNTRFENLYVHEVINDILAKHDIINNIISKHYGIDILSHPYGAGYLGQIKKKNKEYLNINQSKYIKSNKDTFDIKLGYTGSYHFWITLPYIRDNNNHSIINNQNKLAMMYIQTIEPLLCALFSSCDPRSVGDNSKFVEGSYRIMHNLWAGFGTAFTFKPSNITNRQTSYKPTPIGLPTGNSYIDLLYQTLRKNSINTGIDDYSLIDKPIHNAFLSYNQKKYKKYGMNFRTRSDIEGFEFRIFDNFDPKYITDILKIILLISTSFYNLSPIFAPSTTSWNNAMYQTLLNGWNAKINSDYLHLLENQFNISFNFKKLDFYKSEDILNQLVLLLFNKINKNSIYWFMVGDDKKIPKIVNINKASWEFILKNTNKLNPVIDFIIKNIQKKPLTYHNIYNLLLENGYTNILSDLEELLDYLISNKKIFKKANKFFHLPTRDSNP